LIIEFDPPDEPELRARIERIDAADGQMPASDPDKRNARTPLPVPRDELRTARRPRFH